MTQHTDEISPHTRSKYPWQQQWSLFGPSCLISPGFPHALPGDAKSIKTHLAWCHALGLSRTNAGLMTTISTPLRFMRSFTWLGDQAVEASEHVRICAVVSMFKIASRPSLRRNCAMTYQNGWPCRPEGRLSRRTRSRSPSLMRRTERSPGRQMICPRQSRRPGQG